MDEQRRVEQPRGNMGELVKVPSFESGTEDRDF
jgi:hypothetical protein